jgi:hypothetical protein
MKILKEGSLPVWKKVIACYHCDAELEVGKEDLLAEQYGTDWKDSDGHGTNKYRVFFNCPCCKLSRILPSDVEPPVPAWKLPEGEPKFEV